MTVWLEGQYSSGRRKVVTLRSASVMIQNFTPVLSVYADIRAQGDVDLTGGRKWVKRLVGYCALRGNCYTPLGDASPRGGEWGAGGHAARGRERCGSAGSPNSNGTTSPSMGASNAECKRARKSATLERISGRLAREWRRLRRCEQDHYFRHCGPVTPGTIIARRSSHQDGRKSDGYNSLMNAAIPDLRANLSQANSSSAPSARPATMPMWGASPATVVTASRIILPAVVCAPSPTLALKLPIRCWISESLNLSMSDNHALNSVASGSSRSFKTCSISIRLSDGNAGNPARVTTL